MNHDNYTGETPEDYHHETFEAVDPRPELKEAWHAKVHKEGMAAYE